MAKVKLLHNPKAGDEDHSHLELISLIESKGFTCDYSSVKESGWYKISNDTDFVVVAGGDGTVRKVAEKLLQRRLIDKRFPLAILPLGTANNLAKTLRVDVPADTAINSWRSVKKRQFDIGKIFGLENKKFFLESMGFGAFPFMIKRMQNLRLDAVTPEEELLIALKEFRQVIISYKARYCRLTIEDVDYSGYYLMVEIMNIPSIGPNLSLAPSGEVDDGKFEVVLAGEEHRDALASYITSKLAGRERKAAVKVIKARRITISWDGSDGHVDDSVIKVKDTDILNVEVQGGLLEFLV